MELVFILQIPLGYEKMDLYLGENLIFSKCVEEIAKWIKM